MSQHDPALPHIAHAINAADCIFLTIPPKLRRFALEARAQHLEALQNLTAILNAKPPNKT